MKESDRRVCHRCGHVAPDGSDQSHCPMDGLHLVAESEHIKAPRDFFLGTTVGDKYPILGIVGHGGMGAVYRSVQPLVERDVAIKLVLPVQEAQQEQIAERFLREAKAIARLNHPAIVTLFDFGVEADGTAYMVLELVRGRSLSRVLRAGRLDEDQVVRIVLEVLEACEAAHAQGLVHRDLKPENVMLLDDPTGRYCLKVLDFGLAKVASAGSAGPHLTRTGMVFGTPQYMAPEQATGGNVDARTDLYALGVILFQGLAGKLPFDADYPVTVLQHQVSSPVPELPESVSAELRAVVERSMAKEPDDRYSSAPEMAAALAQACDIEARKPAKSQGIAKFTDPETEETLAVGGTVADLAIEDSAPTRAIESARSLESLLDASGEVGLSEVALPRSMVRWRPRLAVSAVVLVLLLALVWRGSDDETADDEGGVTVEVHPTAATAAMADEMEAHGEPTRIELRSQPAGAEVRLGDLRLGVTPLDFEQDGSRGANLTYRLTKAGHRPEELVVTLDGEHQEYDLRLEPMRAPPRRRARTRPAARRPRPKPTPKPAKAGPRVCTKDIECPGELVCEGSQCILPVPSRAPTKRLALPTRSLSTRPAPKKRLLLPTRKLK